MVKERAARHSPETVKMPSRTRESSRGTRCPSISSPRTAWKRPGSIPPRSPGPRPTAFTGEAGKVLLLPGAERRARRRALLGTGDGEASLAIGALAKPSARRRLAFRLRAERSGRSRRSAWCSAAMPSPATARSLGKTLRFSLPAGADAAHVAPRRRRACSWRATWSTRRPTTWDRTRSSRQSGALAGRARGRSVGDQRATPCWRRISR